MPPETTLEVTTQSINPTTILYGAPPSSVIGNLSLGAPLGTLANSSTATDLYASVTVDPSSAAPSTILSSSPSASETGSLANAEQSSAAAASISSSVVAVLTSAGIPPAIATSFAPAVISTPSSTSNSTTTADKPPNSPSQTEQSIIASFVQWLISFFHLTGK